MKIVGVYGLAPSVVSVDGKVRKCILCDKEFKDGDNHSHDVEVEGQQVKLVVR